MISDVLADAIAKIESYQADPTYVAIYAAPSVMAEIEAVKCAMRGLKARLEALPEFTADR